MGNCKGFSERGFLYEIIFRIMIFFFLCDGILCKWVSREVNMFQGFITEYDNISFFKTWKPCLITLFPWSSFVILFDTVREHGLMFWCFGHDQYVGMILLLLLYFIDIISQIIQFILLVTNITTWKCPLVKNQYR